MSMKIASGRPDRVDSLPHLEEWDDEPMTDVQWQEADQIQGTLARRFASGRDYVTKELSVCYQPTDLRRAVKPDVMVVRGLPAGKRSKYLSWKEGCPPGCAFEIASDSTAERDRDVKPLVYAKLGVPELVLFDPELLHHSQPLTLFRLTPQGYEEVELVGGRLYSEVLELEMAAVDYWEDNVRYVTLRFFEPGSPVPLPTPREQMDAAERERCEAVRVKDEAVRVKDEAGRERDEAKREKDEAVREKDDLARRLARLEDALQRLRAGDQRG